MNEDKDHYIRPAPNKWIPVIQGDPQPIHVGSPHLATTQWGTTPAQWGAGTEWYGYVKPVKMDALDKIVWQTDEWDRTPIVVPKIDPFTPPPGGFVWTPVQIEFEMLNKIIPPVEPVILRLPRVDEDE